MSSVPCLSQCTVSLDGKWEGWCWYPDQPQERAVVEVFVDNLSIRTARAARLRTDIRDLGMGDGYCGFQLPLPAKDESPGYRFVEVRERRFGRVIGRVLGQDRNQTTKDTRLIAAADALRAAAANLIQLSVGLRIQGEPLEELGALLSHLSRHSEPSIGLSPMGVFAACQARIAAVPYSDLGWCPSPHVSLVVRATHWPMGLDVETLARVLRDAAQAMQRVGTEIILVDDGTEPLPKLLPSRLRNLRLVRSMPGNPPGLGLNAAALTARGTWLAFARPAAIGTAQLSEAVEKAVDNTFYLEISAPDSRAVSKRHPLQSMMMRKVFQQAGGFDPQTDEPGIWADLLEKAALLDQKIVRWMSVREGGFCSGITASNCDE